MLMHDFIICQPNSTPATQMELHGRAIPVSNLEDIIMSRNSTSCWLNGSFFRLIVVVRKGQRMLARSRENPFVLFLDQCAMHSQPVNEVPQLTVACQTVIWLTNGYRRSGGILSPW